MNEMPDLIMEYLEKRLTCSLGERLLIRSVMEAIVEQSSLVLTEKINLLRKALLPYGFGPEELYAFAQDKVPQYQIVPVEARIQRAYRIYVRVPAAAGQEAVKRTALRQILNGEQMDLMEDVDIEEDDVLCMDVDWDGAANDD